ncbi:ATP-binding protein [Catenulispora subtropica]|uniref:Histidine kinase/HSP90-like ATPase domain-containing protein n=1 Tax=Catenulispora subtropica TaxID=450798 RepID=A0ABN2T982_9ACTN
MSGSGGLATGRQVSEAVLVPDADAPRAARDFAALTLRRWGVPQWGEPVGLVVSELVTNAVRHARTPATLRLIPAEAGVVVEVDDAADGVPRLLPPAGRSSAGGLGLAIVDRLAEAWGTTPRAAGGGKTVWARLRMPDAPAWREAERAADDQIVLELPWDKDMVGMVRSAAGHLAVRAGFERRDLEDLRLAADEIYSLLYAQRPDRPAGTGISCRFVVGPGRVGLEMTAPVAARRPPGVDDFGWHLLQALVDEIEWRAGDRSCGVRAEKRKGTQA